jgi:hypothetical protein
LNSEERIYKQVEELSSSIITALEALEKELSEYIEVTDRRLKKLEEKVQNFESLALVSEKGLLGTKSEKGNSNIMRQADIANNVPHSSETQQSKPVIPPSVVEKPVLDKQQQKTDFKPPKQESKHIIPPVPKPPSFEPKENSNQQPTIPPQIKQQPVQEQKPPVIKEGKKSTEDEQEKEDLMEALKLIDSL